MRSKTMSTTLLLLAGLALAALPAFAAGAVGETAPAFSLKGADGKTYSLADYKGKVVVLEWVNPQCPFSDRHAREKTPRWCIKVRSFSRAWGVKANDSFHSVVLVSVLR